MWTDEFIYELNRRSLEFEIGKVSGYTYVWTVNDAETMRWFIDRKVDYITTNEPERLMELLK